MYATEPFKFAYRCAHSEHERMCVVMSKATSTCVGIFFNPQLFRITYSTDYHQRHTLESWFTNLEQMPLNRSPELPVPYKRLIDYFRFPHNTPCLSPKFCINHCF